MRASGHDYGDDGGGGGFPSQTRSHCFSCGELAESRCVPAGRCQQYRKSGSCGELAERGCVPAGRC